MNELIEKSINIEDKIYNVRGVEVMLDSDLANFFDIETGALNRQVKRNIERFDEDFCFQLTENEYEYLKCQIGISKDNTRGGRRNLPYAFTEQGVAMLTSVLHSKVAITESKKIIKAFVKMRHYINYHNYLLPNRVLLLEEKVDNNTKKIDELFDRFDPKDIVKEKIYFEGEFYDAYSLFIDILNNSMNEVIIIDNYAGKELLDILRNINKKIIIISGNIDNVLKKKYESQYSNIKFINNNSFHDRFIIIDRDKLYTCGASFKDLGKKCFSINKINDKDLLDNILNKVCINL